MSKLIVYFQEGQAFVEIGNGYFLCIGTLEEVAKATPSEVVKMVNEAIAFNRFVELDTPKVVKH